MRVSPIRSLCIHTDAPLSLAKPMEEEAGARGGGRVGCLAEGVVVDMEGVVGIRAAQHMYIHMRENQSLRSLCVNMDAASEGCGGEHLAAGHVVDVEGIVGGAHQQVPPVGAPPYRPDAEPLLPVVAAQKEILYLKSMNRTSKNKLMAILIVKILLQLLLV